MIGNATAEERLQRQVTVLIARATEVIALATDVFLDADLSRVNAVIAEDQRIRDLGEELETEVERQLSLGRDRREVRRLLAVIRISHEVELTSGLAANIAKAARRVHPSALDPRIRGRVARLGDQAIAQFRAAADGFAGSDAGAAAAVSDMNDVMGELIRDLMRTSIEAAADDVEDPQSAIQVALMARYFERVGDHAAVIAARALTTFGPGEDDEDLSPE